MAHNIYDPALDPAFQKPYIDVEEQRPEGYTYVHGGFEGTDTRFSFFYPPKEQYEGRFFQFMSPVEGSENASIGRKSMENKIGFANSHGAYFVETNMGVKAGIHQGDGSIIYKASSASAEFSRKVAERIYGYSHRPYGYIYGGSGGAFKTTSCFEMTNTWDGAVPYIHGSPMAIPSVFCVRAHAKRVLRHAFPKIADAVDAGGSGNPYEGLSAEERATLFEATKMGFPLKSWFYYEKLDDGALPVVAAGTLGRDLQYFKDFWELPGYLGADPFSSVHRDRIQCTCTVKAVHLPRAKEEEGDRRAMTGADNAWKREQNDLLSEGETYLVLDGAPTGDIYAYGANVRFENGGAEGLTLTADRLIGDKLVLAPGFGFEHALTKLALAKAGDKVSLDNSDYLAAQTYYRHQTPEGHEFIGWEQFKTAQGTPIYPVREYKAGPPIARGSCGSLQSGNFRGKMIVVAATMDESAFPWQIDWYRQKVKEHFGAEADEHYRVYFFDNSFHDDSEHTVDELHLISYLGGLHQALLDLADWVEKGIPPRDSSKYTIEDGQIVLAPKAEERGAVQPVVTLTAGGEKRLEAKCGEKVTLTAAIGIPKGAGRVTKAEWSFEGEPYAEGTFTQEGENAQATAEHAFAAPGTYFAVCRVWLQREGSKDIYTQVPNLDRVRIIVR